MSGVAEVQPETVLRPGSPREVAVALAEAAAEGRRVVPLGSGLGQAPIPPDEPWVHLSLEGLSGVEEHEPGDLTFTARPGTTLAELDGVLAPHGQWLPVAPHGGPGRTLGGLVATGLGGALHAGYGAVRDQVLGVSVVTGDGRLLRLGGRVMKNVAGFDLVRLMVGSRGTLGVVVSVSMRVFPRPRAERVLILDGVGADALLAAARSVATAPVVPASAVLVRGAGPDARKALVVRLHGAPPSVEADRRTLESVVGAELRPAGEGPDGEAVALLEGARDLGTRGALAFRQGGLPSELPSRWRAFRDALPGAELRADVISGRLRGALPSAGSDDPVSRVREVGRATGRPVLFTALTAELRERVEPWTGLDGDGGLAARLRERFDPRGVLAPTRFGR